MQRRTQDIAPNTVAKKTLWIAPWTGQRHHGPEPDVHNGSAQECRSKQQAAAMHDPQELSVSAKYWIQQCGNWIDQEPTTT